MGGAPPSVRMVERRYSVFCVLTPLLLSPKLHLYPWTYHSASFQRPLVPAHMHRVYSPETRLQASADAFTVFAKLCPMGDQARWWL